MVKNKRIICDERSVVKLKEKNNWNIPSINSSMASLESN
jgi:hypothetical protein